MMLDGWEGQGEVVRTPPLPLPHFSVTLATTTTAVLLQSKMRTSTLEEVRGIRKEEKIPTYSRYRISTSRSINPQ
jgi:hypothetical protein